MSLKRKICVVTGTRAEYGLLQGLLKLLQADAEIELQLIATGMHLSPEFGATWKCIAQDGFTLHRKIETLLSSDSSQGISKSIGLGLIGFAEAFDDLKPDMLVLLGDRFEILSAASSALVSRIPIAHIHGGETTEGAVDEAIRHAVSKMSHLHFTAAEAYRLRVIQLGESPERVFNVGAPGIDLIQNMKCLSQAELEENLRIKLALRKLLVTFHPATLDEDALGPFQALLAAFDDWPEVQLIFTFPNADAGGRAIMTRLQAFVADQAHRAVCFESLGQLRYLSLMRLVDGVVGNSSSGIIEAPSFKVGTIDIGDRQKGRLSASSVIHCEADKKAISKAIETLYSEAYQAKLKETVNPYGSGGATRAIYQTLKTWPLNDLLKKRFYDVPFSLENSA